jgi:hypothetical protein
MGNTPSFPNINFKKPAFLIERMITPEITIGIISGPNQVQGIKLNDEYFHLEACQEYDEKIVFQFEGQHFLELSLGFKGILHYTLTSPTEKKIGQISDTVRKFYKKISMNSNDLDKIERLFQFNLL